MIPRDDQARATYGIRAGRVASNHRYWLRAESWIRVIFVDWIGLSCEDLVKEGLIYQILPGASLADGHGDTKPASRPRVKRAS